eukprot:scaffold7350_cov233-Pinguiococcus_pyrenoidosus.AAC.10
MMKLAAFRLAFSVMGAPSRLRSLAAANKAGLLGSCEDRPAAPLDDFLCCVSSLVRVADGVAVVLSPASPALPFALPLTAPALDGVEAGFTPKDEARCPVATEPLATAPWPKVAPADAVNDAGAFAPPGPALAPKALGAALLIGG